MNYLNNTKNMLVILIVIGILTTAAIGMLLSVPSVLKSNTANIAGHTNNGTNSSDVNITMG
jgi:competence protein ComGC